MNLRYKDIERFTTTFGIGGLISIAIGTTAITASTIALQTNVFNVLDKHETLVKETTRFGTTFLGTGLIALGIGVGVARHVGENHPFTEDEKRYLAKIEKCKNCKYFHGVQYYSTDLICAVNPSGLEGDNCPDWEQKHD